MTPAVSIILPIYNVNQFLKQCLDSVVNQTLKDIEIICIDDGSTDSSPAILDHYAAQDKRVRVIHKENGGYGKAVNTGLDIAQGQYIGIIEPDDYIDKRMFEKLIEHASRFNNPDIVKSAYWRVSGTGKSKEQISPCGYYNSVEHTDVLFTLEDDAEFLFHHPSIWTAIYRFEFLKANNIRMREIPGAGWADNPWLIETLSQAQSIAYLDECLYYYREFNTGSSSNVKDPSIIYNRWLDMDEFLKLKKITAPKIIEGHYSRGCAYIGMLIDDFDQNDPQIQEAINQMLERLDLTTIVKSKKIPSYFKSPFYSQISPATWLTHPFLFLRCAGNSMKRRLTRLLSF